MRPALLILGYLGLNLAFFCSALRARSAMRRESAILSFHVASFGILAAALIVFVLWSPDPQRAWAIAALALASHGIYSLTFLELWSLTQGSYSLAILGGLCDRPGQAELAARLGAFARIGEMKRRGRLLSLERLGLLRDADGSPKLTLLGRLCAGILGKVIVATNGRSLNA